MDVPPEIAPFYEMTKRRHMTAILNDINCQLTDSEFGNLSPYWTVDNANYLHRAQHDREVATTAFLDQYWETVRRSYADLGVLCMPPFSIPLDFQQPADDSMRWQEGSFGPRRQTFAPVLVTYDGVGFHEYILAHAEVNGQPFPNYGARDAGENTLVFALADHQHNPTRQIPSLAPQSSTSQRRRRSFARIPSIRSSRAPASRPLIPLPSTPPQPDTMHPHPTSLPIPQVDPLAAALSAAKSLLLYPESEPFRAELKIFIDLLIETRASEVRAKTALSNPKFLKRLGKFMRWYEDIEGERTLGKKLLFKIEDQPRLRDFFIKLTHAPDRRPVVVSRQTLDLERVERTLGTFQELVDRMVDLTNDPNMDV
ncbi:hypothetical protein CALVIDRAFT_601637 [Calocera viscosa TUFC12733]|uniref:Uncharacterized protein n=1 Tax=Calocera viscosa (strain TUFC12733) TaxID=1330018 RepID=A0A167I4V8_CALVF|nr:hypothetical protein CALVIDRAFT_601637 [Calocera viscosa TUFC12733]